VTAPSPVPSPTAPGSVLDGDPRILIPLPEAAERLGISRLGARDLHVPAAVLRCIEQEGLPPTEPEGGEAS
jgi:hypothetical protein